MSSVWQRPLTTWLEEQKGNTYGINVLTCSQRVVGSVKKIADAVSETEQMTLEAGVGLAYLSQERVKTSQKGGRTKRSFFAIIKRLEIGYDVAEAHYCRFVGIQPDWDWVFWGVS